MSSQQKNILWIGIIVVFIFLFTDQNFRNQIFHRGVSTVSATKPTTYTLAQILTVPATTSSGTSSVKLV